MMKKRLFFLLALLFVNAAPIIEAVAKPAYCGAALQGCYNDCGGGLFGFFCGWGCYIGYAFC